METKYFIGLDVHKNSTTYAVRDPKGFVLLEGQCATQYKDLDERFQRYKAWAEVGMEASTSYYVVYQEFLKNGYAIKIANTIQMRQLISKSDKLDANRLAEMLRLRTFPCSYIPCEEIRHMRDLVRLRHAFMEDRTRWNVRIQALLDRSGFVMPPFNAFGKRWRLALEQHLEKDACLELRHAYDHYLYLAGKVKQLDQDMIAYASAHWPKEYELVRSIPGFGQILACYVLADVLPIGRFASKRKLRRYVGVVPVFKDSGEKKSEGRIPKQASRGLLRWAFVQAAHAIARTSSNLGCRYRKKKKQKKNAGLAAMAVASSISDILYTVLTTKKPYTPTEVIHAYTKV